MSTIGQPLMGFPGSASDTWYQVLACGDVVQGSGGMPAPNNDCPIHGTQVVVASHDIPTGGVPRTC